MSPNERPKIERHEALRFAIVTLAERIASDGPMQIEDVMWGMTKAYAEVMAKASLMRHMQSGHQEDDDLAYTHIGRAGMLFDQCVRNELRRLQEEQPE